MSGISNMPQESVVPGGIGVREESTHPECGLRLKAVSFPASSAVIDIAFGGNMGGVGGADVTDWTPIPWGTFIGRLTTPATPNFAVSSALPAGKSFRLRVRGLSQFYAHQTEITPWVAMDAVLLNTVLPISKVFAYVGLVEFQSINMDLATDSVVAGTSILFDPINVADFTNNGAGALAVVHPENNGFGIPIRISPYGTEDPYLHPEILGDVMLHNPAQTVDDATIPAIASVKPFPTSGAGAGFTIGLSAPGFQGDTHKLGFHSTDAWVAQVINKVDGTGEFRMGGEIEGVASVPPRNSDNLEISYMVRSSLGTRRRANPKSSYEYAQN